MARALRTTLAVAASAGPTAAASAQVDVHGVNDLLTEVGQDDREHLEPAIQGGHLVEPLRTGRAVGQVRGEVGDRDVRFLAVEQRGQGRPPAGGFHRGRLVHGRSIRPGDIVTP